MKNNTVRICLLWIFMLFSVIPGFTQEYFTLFDEDIYMHELSVETYGAKMWGVNYYVYKPTAGVNIEYNNNLFCVGLGYLKFKPTQDTFYIADNSDLGYGTRTYSDYLMFPLYIGYNRGLELSDNSSLFCSFQGGYNYVYYETDEYTDSNHSGESYIGGMLNISPKTACRYMLSDRLCLFVFFRYTLLIGFDAAIHHYSSLGAGVSYDFLY